MTTPVLKRIFALADAPAPESYAKLASILRKLGGQDDTAAKAHGVAGMLKGLGDAEQDALLRAVEGLVKP